MPIGSSHHSPKIGRFPLFLLVNLEDRRDYAQTFYLQNRNREGPHEAWRKIYSIFCLNFFQPQNSMPQLRVVLSKVPVIPIFGNLVYLIAVHERVSLY